MKLRDFSHQCGSQDCFVWTHRLKKPTKTPIYEHANSPPHPTPPNPTLTPTSTPSPSSFCAKLTAGQFQVLCFLSRNNTEHFVHFICIIGATASTWGTLTIAEGDDAVLECNATDSDGKLITLCINGMKLLWSVNGSITVSCSERNAHYTRHIQFDNRTGTLTIPNVRLSDEGVFTCAVYSRNRYRLSTTKLIVIKGKCIKIVDCWGGRRWYFCAIQNCHCLLNQPPLFLTHWLGTFYRKYLDEQRKHYESRIWTRDLRIDVPGLYQLSYLALHWRSPYFVNIFVRGAPVKSHETIYCPLARDHAQVTI